MTGEGYAQAAAQITGALVDLHTAHSANRTNRQLAERNQQFQERLANTGYQRAVADLKQAGLNPMLAYSQGPAATPNTSAATVRPAQVGSQIGNAVQSALTIERMRIDNDQARENLEQTKRVNDEWRADSPDIGGHGVRVNKLYRDQQEQDARIANAQLDNKIKAQNLSQQEVETRVIQALEDPRISSAKSQAELVSKQVTGQELRNMLDKLKLPEAKAMAEWFEAIGSASPALKATMTIGEWLKLILTRGR